MNVDSSQVGEQLYVNKDYFDKAYNSIYEISIKLAHTIWRKLKPEERQQADYSLNNLCLNLISDEEYSLALILLDFALTEPISKKSILQTKLSFILNKAQALKWMGECGQSKKILASQDWSACSDKFKLAKAVLLDEFDTAAKIMMSIGNNPEKISILHYREWPIFKEFRKTKQFLEAYQCIFNEKFEMVTETSLPIIETDEQEE